MELNAWYYTLSTISQTLAAILGLAAVFCILRLQRLMEKINDFKERATHILRVPGICIESYKNPIPTFSDKTSRVLVELRNFNSRYKNGYRSAPGMNETVSKMAEFTYSQITPKDKDIYFIGDTLDNLESFVSQKDDLIKMIKLPGIIVSITISVSIILLGLTDQVINNSLIILLLLIVAAALFSIWSIVRACWKIILAIKVLE